MSHVTTWRQRDATTVFRGHIDARDFLRLACDIASDDRFETKEFFVADFVEVTGHDIDHDSVRDDLAAQAMGAQPVNPRFRIVVVTDDPGIEAFTDRMRAVYAGGGPEVFSFRTREDAARWMDEQPRRPLFLWPAP